MRECDQDATRAALADALRAQHPRHPACALGLAVKLWDSLTGAFVATLRGHVGPVYQACIHPADCCLLARTCRHWHDE